MSRREEECQSARWHSGLSTCTHDPGGAGLSSPIASIGISRCRMDRVTRTISTPGRSTRRRSCAACARATTVSTATILSRRSKAWEEASATPCAARFVASCSIFSSWPTRRRAIRGPIGWARSSMPAAEIENKLSSSLRRDAEERLARLYVLARKQAALDLLKYHEDEAARSLPTECPYTLDQNPRRGLVPRTGRQYERRIP